MLTARLRYSVATQTPSVDDDKIDNSCTACKRQNSTHCMLKFSQREDLECLAAGLEGRNSGKPLSLLMDQLAHPCLDAGLDVPSLLEWKSPDNHKTHKPIDHVVLGKGPPGGTWHVSISLHFKYKTVKINIECKSLKFQFLIKTGFRSKCTDYKFK